MGMDGLIEGEDDCAPLNGCGSVTAVPFYLSFTIIVTFVMLNIFVAVILEGYEESKDGDMALTEAQFTDFLESWRRFDPTATHILNLKDFKSVLRSMQHPLGFYCGANPREKNPLTEA